MTLPIVFMFSGQGSQYYQMGKELFEQNKTFQAAMLKVNRLCQDLVGFSILDEIYHPKNPKSQPFTRTLFTHPTIFMVEYSMMQVMRENNIDPKLVVGSSAGEFAAAVSAGVLTLETALQAVIKQAQALEQYCQEAGMLAILADTSLYQSQSYLHQFSELAAVNFSSHFVVSGKTDHLKMIETHLKENDIAFQLLPVSQGFHSSLIDNAKTPFLESIQSLSIKQPAIPYVSCVYANTLTSLTHQYFWEIARSPIQFQKAIQHIENQHSAIYLDLGPSGTLATFVKYNLTSSSQSKLYSILSPYGQDIENLGMVLNANQN